MLTPNSEDNRTRKIRVFLLVLLLVRCCAKSRPARRRCDATLMSRRQIRFHPATELSTLAILRVAASAVTAIWHTHERPFPRTYRSRLSPPRGFLGGDDAIISKMPPTTRAVRRRATGRALTQSNPRAQNFPHNHASLTFDLLNPRSRTPQGRGAQRSSNLLTVFEVSGERQ